ncbi:NitT/TauT family transport system permease protein [Pseudonocardia hierapolitana]|uniref:NitT/TauT family transport system permease protein n=1 Tax=Pseudonocardia hierapolitana TaxID=1128676 RepID=A0A561T2T8_9PSEU|nr:ABC transporter permease [Pseudonocardia hierapolitana]TWF81432.1 NitT/TauT family transport system permease protein [Pseudonocardia hierapolitana]
MTATVTPDVDRSAAVLARAAAADRRRARSERAVLWAGTAAVGASILLFWQFGLGHLVNPRYVSDPATIAGRVGELAAEGEIFRHVGVTIGEAAAGFAIGSVLGLASAFALAQTRRGYAVFEPFLVGFYSIPKIALAPLFILWFGLGTAPKIVMAALLVYFVVFVNTATGIREVRPGLLHVCRVLGASRRDLLLKVTLPSAAPAIVASVRITVTRAIEGALLSEFVASTQGLGYLVARASREFDIATVFAGIVVIAAVVMTANGLLRFLQARLAPWHSGQVHG